MMTEKVKVCKEVYDFLERIAERNPENVDTMQLFIVARWGFDHYLALDGERDKSVELMNATRLSVKGLKRHLVDCIINGYELEINRDVYLKAENVQKLAFYVEHEGIEKIVPCDEVVVKEKTLKEHGLGFLIEKGETLE